MLAAHRDSARPQIKLLTAPIFGNVALPNYFGESILDLFLRDAPQHIQVCFRDPLSEIDILELDDHGWVHLSGIVEEVLDAAVYQQSVADKNRPDGDLILSDRLDIGDDEHRLLTLQIVARTGSDALRIEFVSLTDQSGALAELGRREEALTASTEAVQMYQELAKQHPVFRESLAASLTSLGIRHTELDDHDAALSADREAVSTYAALLPFNPERYRDSLEQAVRKLVIDLRNLGRSEQEIADELDALSLPDAD